MPKRRVQTFTGDLAKITRIQRTYLPTPRDMPSFVYFRKGEFENGPDVCWKQLLIIAQWLAISLPSAIRAAKRTPAALTRLYKQILRVSSHDDMQLPGTLRIIASPQTDEVTVSLRILTKIGFTKKRIAAAKRGVLRYFVRPDKYCIFFRVPGGRFFGIQGTDKKTIRGLRRLFDAEWDS